MCGRSSGAILAWWGRRNRCEHLQGVTPAVASTVVLLPSGSLSLVTAFLRPSPHGRRAPACSPPPCTPAPQSLLPVPHPHSGRWPSASQLRPDWRQGGLGPQDSSQGWSGGCTGGWAPGTGLTEEATAQRHAEAEGASPGTGDSSRADVRTDGRAASLQLWNRVRSQD